MDVLKKNIIFVGGKGGVGKSSSAAAIAWKLSKNGHKTLLVSTDPAHNIGDLFRTKIGGTSKQLADNLFALEIDPDRETDLYIKGIKENIKGIVHAGMMEEVHRQLDTAKASPGAEEAAIFDKLITIILEEKENYSKIVFDTAPTGHTIRLLTLPELMGIWIEGLLQKRQKTNENYSQLFHDGEPIDDPIYRVLQARQERFRRAREVLLNEKETGFLFVLNLERLPIVETEKAISLLGKHQMRVQTIIINKVLPLDVEGDFMMDRKEHEKEYAKIVKETFINQELIYVPLLSRDIRNHKDLQIFSQSFRRDESI